MTDTANVPAELVAALEAVRDAPAGEPQQQAAEQIIPALLNAFGPGTAARLEALALQRQAVEKLRLADRLEYRAAFVAVVAEAEQSRQAAESEAEMLAEVERVSLGNVRQAEDRHREAAEHHRECAQAADDAATTGDTPQVQTELLVFADKAQQVADRFAAKLDQARQTHARDVSYASAAREQVKVAKQAEAAARAALTAAEQHPENAPRSAYTLLLGLSDAVKDSASLTNTERSTLRGLVASLSTTIGADAAAVERGHQQGLAEGRDEARRATSTMPQTQQTIQAPRM